VPVIAQEAGSNDVLMFAWMNREALAKTVELGEAVYWSRSRKKLWHKGEESGHVQKVLEIRLDCDEDVVLLKIEQAGGIACHTGRHSCFFQKFEGDAQEGDWQNTEPVLKDPTTFTRQANEHHPDRLADVIESRKLANGGDPATSYTSKLFAKGDDAILKKIGEEATETVMAAKDARRRRQRQGAVRSGRLVVPYAGAAGAVRPEAAASAR
jgi:phosphoribosyl-AMP cyclohydrolase